MSPVAWYSRRWLGPLLRDASAMTARSRLITPLVRDAASLGATVSREMFALYERYYGGASYPRFVADLAGKDHVLLLHDEAGALQGFSTLAVYERPFGSETVRGPFSG